MIYSTFGTTGLKMSRIGFGVQTLGWTVERSDAFSLLDFYTGEGGNYIDMADSYNSGKSEEITGEWLGQRGHRSDLLIGSKVFFPTGDGPNDSGLSRKHIISSVETSLKRLGTDYLDFYQIHCWDALTPLSEISRTMDILIRDGKIRYYGLSNYTPSQISKSMYVAMMEGQCPPSSVQLEYSLLVRSPEWELIPVCGEYGLGILAWSPLSGGWLTGKYRRDRGLPADSRAGIGERWDDTEEQRGGERTYRIIDSLIGLSEKYGKPVAQISLAWLLGKKPAVFPLVGATRKEQLAVNMEAVDISLEDEDEALLDRISDPGLPYPYSFIKRYTRYA